MFSYKFSQEPLNLLPQNRCLVRGFRQFLITSHKTPRLPRNLHLVATWHSHDNAIRKKHATRHISSAAPATQNDDGHVRSAAPATKSATHLAKTSQKYCAWHRKRLLTHVWMSRSAPATWNEATRRLKPPNITSSADLTMGTAIRPSRERLRMVADGCERLGNVERTHPQPPDPQSETGTLATHSGKKNMNPRTAWYLSPFNFIVLFLFVDFD